MLPKIWGLGCAGRLRTKALKLRAGWCRDLGRSHPLADQRYINVIRGASFQRLHSIPAACRAPRTAPSKPASPKPLRRSHVLLAPLLLCSRGIPGHGAPHLWRDAGILGGLGAARSLKCYGASLALLGCNIAHLARPVHCFTGAS